MLVMELGTELRFSLLSHVEAGKLPSSLLVT